MALVKYGRFAPNGHLLYFMTDEGAQIIIGEFADVAECAGMAIAFNSFLPQSNYQEQKATATQELEGCVGS